MAGWETVEKGLNVSEYAKRVCREIGWPYSGNLTLICDCISSLACMKGVDAWGGFFILMASVENARKLAVRIDRWFFQDGKYVDLIPSADTMAPWEVPAAAPTPATAVKPN